MEASGRENADGQSGVSLPQRADVQYEAGESYEDLSTEIFNLRKRIGDLESNLNSLSAALKNTLTDIRSIISELDNPFNILRSVGVDELLEKCIEHVREEVSRIKRDEMKKSLVRGDEKPQASTQIVSCRGLKSEQLQEKSLPAKQGQKEEAHLPTNIKPSKEATSHPLTAETFTGFTRPPTVFHGVVSKGGKPISVSLDETFSTYRTAYLMLAAGYLLLRVGGRRADLIITEYVKRGWITPRIARDLADIIRMLGFEGRFWEESMSIDMEDHILLINYLRRVEEQSVVEENPVNMLFMLFLSKSISHMLHSIYSMLRRR
jgi:hypothetical protein